MIISLGDILEFKFLGQRIWKIYFRKGCSNTCTRNHGVAPAVSNFSTPEQAEPGLQGLNSNSFQF